MRPSTSTTNYPASDPPRGGLQFGLPLLIHAYLAARPCSTTNTETSKTRSSTAGVTAGHGDGSNVALCAPLTKQSLADQMFVAKEQRVFDDDVARAIRYKDIDLLRSGTPTQRLRLFSQPSLPYELDQDTGKANYTNRNRK
ncbi:hypothetical protein LTR17_020157 [Elasticomyces elasticus]|nr:hypothetical protein LTR17_020157 [Elasticomyces elasticus]